MLKLQCTATLSIQCITYTQYTLRTEPQAQAQHTTKLLMRAAVIRPPAGDLAAWQRIAWWEGPDGDGHLWLMIDFRAAVSASRTHGPELVARVLVSNVGSVLCCTERQCGNAAKLNDTAR